jgi:hypothetical protein
LAEEYLEICRRENNQLARASAPSADTYHLQDGVVENALPYTPSFASKDLHTLHSTQVYDS